MKVLLVNPPHALSAHNPLKSAGLALPPLGLLSVAAFLRQESPGVELRVIDWPGRRLSPEGFASEVAAFRPDIAGVSVYTGTLTSAARAAAAIKKAAPGCFTVAGGHHATVRPRQCLDQAGFDAAVLGEGERPFAELVRRIQDGAELDGIPGVALPNGGGDGSGRYDPLDLDALPMPARDLVDLRLYRPAVFGYRRLPVTSMVTSRGCPFSCRFCSKSIFGSRYRAQDPSRTISEVRHLLQAGIKEISFQDDTFTVDRERVLKFCRAVRGAALDLTWSCMTRVDLVDRELLAEMSRSGCISIAFGIDGASDGSCDLMGKGFAVAQAKAAVAAARAERIETRGYYILGYPGETLDSMRAALKNIMAIDTDHVFLAFAHPFFDTELYAEAKSRGLLLAGDAELCDSDDNTQPVIRVPGAGPKDLIGFYKRAYLRYYLRPSRLVRLAALGRGGGWAHQFRACAHLLRWFLGPGASS